MIKEKIRDLVRSKLFLWTVGYTILFLISGFWKYLEVLLIPYLIGAFIFLSIEDDLYFFLITQIFYVSVLLSRPSIVAQAIYIAVLLVKFIIGVKSKKYELHRNLLIMIAIFTGYSILMSFFHRMAIYSLSYLFYLPFFYMVFATRQEYDIRKMFRIFSYTIIAVSVVSLISIILPHYGYHCLKYEGESIRFRAFFGSANGLYMVALLALSGIIYLYFKKQIGIFELLFNYFSLGLITLLTLSKAGIAIFGIISVIGVVLYLVQDFKKHIWHILLILVLIAIALFVFKDFALRVVGRYTKSYDSGNILNSLFTGRIDIWKDYLRAIFRNPFNALFGHGMLSKYVYCVAQGRERAQHNLYIFLMYKFGICGTILLFLVIREFIVASGKKAPSFINYLPLIYFLILGMCDNAFMYTHFYILVAFVLFNTKNKENIKEVKNNNKNTINIENNLRNQTNNLK